ncbi:diaminopimelate epimerase [Chloroflexota bacterium]
MEFTKLQATGNDFIMIDARRLEQDWATLARAMCCRRFGIGSDGIILLLKSEVADFRMRMFNPDGSEAEVCGNGLRCFARYVMDRDLADTQELTIETIAGIRKVESSAHNRFQVDMGPPRLKAEEIPVSIKDIDIIPILNYPLQIEGRVFPLSFVSIGNPHAVYFTEKSVSEFPLLELGPVIEHHPIFPQRVNFEVAEVISRGEIRARVWERGAGETLSCGSGACAVAIAARLNNLVDSPVDIILPGGMLSITWDGQGEVWLSGKAEIVFQGKWL